MLLSIGSLLIPVGSVPSSPLLLEYPQPTQTLAWLILIMALGLNVEDIMESALSIPFPTHTGVHRNEHPVLGGFLSPVSLHLGFGFVFLRRSCTLAQADLGLTVWPSLASGSGAVPTAGF